MRRVFVLGGIVMTRGLVIKGMVIWGGFCDERG
jgi:hypothetical protein